MDMQKMNVVSTLSPVSLIGSDIDTEVFESSQGKMLKDLHHFSLELS
jgi:hypothetical protein